MSSAGKNMFYSNSHLVLSLKPIPIKISIFLQYLKQCLISSLVFINGLFKIYK